MNGDIDTRLRRAAEVAREREPSAPSLDVMLDAVSSSATKRPRRQRMWAMAAAVATVGIVAGAVVAVSHRPGSDNSPQPGTPLTTDAPPTITVDGKTLRNVGVEPWATPVLDENDPHIVWVYASIQGGPSCYVQPVAYVSADSEESVTVFVATYAADVSTPSGDGRICTEELRAPARLSVTLTDPLGTRKLIDRTTGESHAVLDPATVPRPAYLPDGYSAAGPVSWGNQRVGQTTTSAVREYVGPGDNRVTITIGPTSLLHAQSHVIEHTTVDGHTATVSDSSGFEQDILIAWDVDATHTITVYQMSTYDPKYPGLTTDELLRVANSVK